MDIDTNFVINMNKDEQLNFILKKKKTDKLQLNY